MSLPDSSVAARSARRSYPREYGRKPAVSPVACLVLALAIGLGLSGCGGREGNGLSKRVVEYGQPVPKGGGVYKTGKPYQINGRWYRPAEQPNYDRVGVASWYGDLFHGRYTANGEIYDMDRLSAAHPTLPLPTLAKVTNLTNGRSVVVRVNDRGPFAHNRIIDLSRQSARVLGFERKGTAPVRVQVVGRAPMNGDDNYERRYLAGQPWARAFYAHLEPHKKQAAVERSRGIVTAKADGSITSSIARKRSATRKLQPMTVGTPEPEARVDFPSQLAAPADAGLFVQAASFRDRDNAERAKARLAEVGAVHIEPVSIRSDTYFRVRIGPFAERSAASLARTRTTRNGFPGALITEN